MLQKLLILNELISYEIYKLYFLKLEEFRMC